MNTPLWRQLVPCLASFVFIAGMSVPAFADALESRFPVNQWIRQSEDGSIQGNLLLPQADGAALAVNPAVVALMSKESQLKSTRADEQGGFGFDDVEPGVYTLMVRGPQDVCSVVALHVISSADEAAAGLPQEVELAVGQIPYAAINTMMIRYLPPQPSASNGHAALNVNVEGLQPIVAAPGAYRIAQSNGGMVGQIFGAGASGNRLNPSSQTNIFLFQNGEEVQRVVSDSSGVFTVESLDPGVYSALIIGASGMGLVGFELVSELSAQVTAIDHKSSLVKVQDSDVATQFVMQVAPGGMVMDTFQGMGAIPGEVIVSEQVIGDEIADTGFGVPMGGGGFAGGGGFGGGGGGGGGGLLGGGGLGGLLGIGGLAAAIVALATDDDVVIASPGSP